MKVIGRIFTGLLGAAIVASAMEWDVQVATFQTGRTSKGPKLTSMRLQSAPVLRVARPTDDLDAVERFYNEGLGLETLYRFTDHDGFDGIMLGRSGWPYHLEFTRARGHRAGRAPTADNLLVFYLPEADRWRAAVQRMEQAGFAPVAAFNPYWDRLGVTFEDPDGYRVVLQHDVWEA